MRSLAGGTLFGEIWGEPPGRVLALHGWARSHTDFAGVFGDGVFGQTTPGAVVAPDLPGFGATPAPPEAWGSADYASALEALFRPGGEMGVPAILVAHSFGGRVAVALASARPDLVAGLVLTGVPLLPPSDSAGRATRTKPRAGYRAIRALQSAGVVSEERLEKARQRYGSADYRNAQGVMRSVLVRVVGEDYTDELAALAERQVPTELVWADDDSEAPFEVAERLSTAIPGSTLVSCPGAGHLTPLTAPRELRQAVERLLGTVT